MKSQSHEIVKLTRDVEATEIPSGNKIIFYSGTEVIITQALGGTFTVLTHQGAMASIGGKDADALGKATPQEVLDAQKAPAEGQPIDDKIWAALKTCYDPEIPHNIVDLGLIYQCDIAPLLLDGQEVGNKVYLKMTLTAPGCGMGDWLKTDIQQKLLAIPGIKQVEVDVVFDPPWDRSRMSPALRREFF